MSEASATVASVSTWDEKPRPRIILSRTLTFKLRTPYRNLESALVDVSGILPGDPLEVGV